MNHPSQPQCIAFEGMRRIASGDLPSVAREAKAVIDRGHQDAVLLFDIVTSERIDLDFQGTPEAVSARAKHLAAQRSPPTGATENKPPAEPPADVPRGPGRPKLGVVAREVTLLPRHWDWLGSQPGGASVALRKLVEEARRVNADKDRLRQSQEATYRFMSPMAGHLPGFEEATRALFAADTARFHSADRGLAERRARAHHRIGGAGVRAPLVKLAGPERQVPSVGCRAAWLRRPAAAGWPPCPGRPARLRCLSPRSAPQRSAGARHARDNFWA